MTPALTQAVYLVRHGRVILNEKARTVELVLEDGTRHVVNADGTYQVVKFDRQLVSVSAASVFPSAGPTRGDPELSIFDLQVRAAGAKGHP